MSVTFPFLRYRNMYVISLVLLVAAVGLWDPVDSHGYLAKPVNRGSMWRNGYNTPLNYDDMGLFCGGRAVQWDLNDGKCGECGDNYADPRPRANENTGKFGLGISVGTYARGSTIDVSVDVTANHMGFFEFRLCPLATKTELESQECFDNFLLKVQGGSGTRYYLPNSNTGLFNLTVTLPSVTCDLCVLQWTYTTGNSWGTCSNGTERLGCGPQETFRTCSDITLV